MPREEYCLALDELPAQRRAEVDAAFTRHKLKPETFEQARVKGHEFIVLGTTYQLDIFGTQDSEITWNTENPNRGDFVSQ